MMRQQFTGKLIEYQFYDIRPGDDVRWKHEKLGTIRGYVMEGIKNYPGSAIQVKFAHLIPY